MSVSRQEWRVVWKRVGNRRKAKRFAGRASAERFMVLFGPEPWNYYLKPGEDADTLMCCSGYQCGCGGETYRQRSDYQRARQPGLEYVRLESRARLPWDAEESDRIGEAVLSTFPGNTGEHE